MNISWDDVRLLEAIERHGNLKAAARELGLSVSTLYRRIGAAEDVLGEPCLLRGSEGELTEVARTLAGVGRKTRALLAEVVADKRAQDASVTGTVSVTTVAALESFIRGAIASVLRAHPGLQVELHLGDSGPSVRDHEVDIAISIVPRPPAGCFGRRLARLGYGVYGTGPALSSTPPQFVAQVPTGSPECAWEARTAKHVVARAPFHALVELCAAGVGLGLMPRIIGERHGLVRVPAWDTSTARLARTVWILVHPDRRKVPRIAAVMGALSAGFLEATGAARDPSDPIDPPGEGP